MDSHWPFALRSRRASRQYCDGCVRFRKIGAVSLIAVNQAAQARALPTMKPTLRQMTSSQPMARPVEHRRPSTGESLMNFGLQGKWALVGGASKGLGLGCATALAAEGVNVVMVARGVEALDAAAIRLRQDSGVRIVAVAADITTEAGRQAVFRHAEGPGADFDIVVTNAGGPPPGAFHDWDRDAWIKALDANMLTPIALIQATIDGMQRRGFGRIVNITSSAVKAPIANLGLSNGARSGLTGFVAGMARNPEIAARGVTINNLLPGRFDTDRLSALLDETAAQHRASLDEARQIVGRTIPAGRVGDPKEFGEVCAFLCSRQAAYLTGQNILLDGGAYPGTF